MLLHFYSTLHSPPPRAKQPWLFWKLHMVPELTQFPISLRPEAPPFLRWEEPCYQFLGSHGFTCCTAQVLEFWSFGSAHSAGLFWASSCCGHRGREVVVMTRAPVSQGRHWGNAGSRHVGYPSEALLILQPALTVLSQGPCGTFPSLTRETFLES